MLPARCEISSTASGRNWSRNASRSSTAGVAPENSSSAPARKVSEPAICGTTGAMYSAGELVRPGEAAARCAASSLEPNSSVPHTSGTR